MNKPVILIVSHSRELRFANEAAATHDMIVVMPNELIVTDNWAQLSPFGDFDNAQGMQRVTPEDGAALVNEFKAFSLANVATRVMGLPWYVGHPDHPAFKERYKDGRAYGRIKDLQVRHDPACNVCNEFRVKRVQPCAEHGIFANVKWNADGKTLIESEAYHGHSVNWAVAKRGGVYHPVALRSVGFTNEPGIPVKPVTTANEKAAMQKLIDFIKSLIGESAKDIADEDSAVDALKKHTDAAADAAKKKAEEAANAIQERDETKAKLEGANAVLAANEKAFRDALTAATVAIPDGTKSDKLVELFVNEFATAHANAAKLTKSEADRAAAEASFANERKAHAEAVKARFIAEGRMSKAEADAPEFANELGKDIGAAVARVSALPVKYRQDSSLAGSRTKEVKDRQGTILEMVNERMAENAKNGNDASYDAAWGQIKKENPELFANMKQPDK